MKREKNRKRTAWMLAVCLCLALLPGCSKKEAPVKPDETGQMNTEEPAGGDVFQEVPVEEEEMDGTPSWIDPPASDMPEENETTETGNTENIQTEINVNPDELAKKPEVSGSGKDEREKFSGDIYALDNNAQGWGQGVQFDDKNRPGGAVSAQEKYGKYSADFIRTGEEEAKRMYLTFDEGYENGYTAQILDVLKEKNCPAVFFVTMPYVKQQPELIRRMIDEGHIVGNHSVTHPSAGLPSQSKEQQEKELMELHQYVKDNFGYEMSLFRYPAGKFSEQSLAIVQNLDYTSVFWSFAYKDWDPQSQPEETAALAKLKERMHPGAIYLLHAVSKTNTNILGQFIDAARAAGYEFVSYR